MYGIYLIAVLVVTGGVIAFIGDRLGTKIGKKRLSIFGLRPRHTSNIITIITGFVITALTIGIMSAMSENVRTALFGMEELNSNLTRMQSELNNVSDELIMAQNEYQQANEDLEKSKSEVEKLREEQLKLKNESDRLKDGNKTLELVNAKLIDDNDKLSSENENLSANNDKLSNENKTLTENNTMLSQNNDKLSTDNKELEQRNEYLRDGIVAMREGDIVFRAGEILASGVIEGNRDADAIVNDIDSMAEMATANVSRRVGNTGEQSVWIYQPELKDAVQTISESKQPMILRITAAGNLVRGEPVRTSLELYKNNKVFNKGEFIIERSYDLKDKQSVEQIVQRFLQEINHEAVMKGILPDPLSGTIGAMEVEQFYQVVDEINKIKGKVILKAYARDLTETIGPLRLNIKVVKE